MNRGPLKGRGAEHGQMKDQGAGRTLSYMHFLCLLVFEACECISDSKIKMK